MYFNQAVIAGNLTRDPELKALPSGAKICEIGIATNRSYTDQSGNKKDETEYHSVKVFGKQAETCATYLKKGQEALVVGRLHTSSWEKDGAKFYKTEIVADNVQFGRAPSGNGGGATAPSPSIGGGHSMAQAEREFKNGEVNLDQVPF